MAVKIKHVSVPGVRQVALDNVPLKNGPHSQSLGEEPMFIFFSVVKNDQTCPNKMIDCSDGRFSNFIQGLKLSFIS